MPQKTITSVELKEIKKILPQKGKMILLDTVYIDDDIVQGTLFVRRETCEEHGVRIDDRIVMKGSDLYDMCAQLLGIWADKALGLTDKKVFVVKYGSAKFLKFVKEGETIVLKVRAKDLAYIGNARKIITGRDFEIHGIDGQKAEISFVEMFAI